MTPRMQSEVERFPIEIRRISGLSYAEVLDMQRNERSIRVEARRQGFNPFPDMIWGVEHAPVYTLGLHGKPQNFLVPVEQLRAMGAEVVMIERGGDVTFHGPGQLVVYPIVDLSRYHLGVKSYISLLEQGVINVLARHGIRGERVEGATGVWIGAGTPAERKICAIGVSMRRFVSMHGLALNVNTDLSWFSRINPCGFVDKGVTSMKVEAAHEFDFDRIASGLCEELRDLLMEKAV